MEANGLPATVVQPFEYQFGGDAEKQIPEGLRRVVANYYFVS